MLGFAINKYSYVCLNRRPPLGDFKTRVAYYDLERVNSNTDISQNAVRATLCYAEEEGALDISHIGDLPARKGLGSSSAFVVGLYHAIQQLNNRPIMPQELAEAAIVIERSLLGELGGAQDQYWAALGGLNSIQFTKKGIRAIQWDIDRDFLQELQEHILLVSTNIERSASEVTKSYKHTVKLQKSLANIAKEGETAIFKCDLKKLGLLLHQNWLEKIKMSHLISNNKIDELYKYAIRKGALGGKICGAGAGGFMVLLMPPELQSSYLEETKTIGFNIQIDTEGSKVIYEN